MILHLGLSVVTVFGAETRSGNRFDSSASDPGVHRRHHLMGTWLDVTLLAADRSQAIAASEAVVRAVAEAEQRLSTWREDSELSLLNQYAAKHRVIASPLLARDLSEALHWHRSSRGAFNPAMGALLEAWNFKASGRIPGDSELREALAHSKIRGQLLQGSAVKFPQPGLRIEAGGFGKGAALVDALEAARATGARCTILDFGGQVAVGGECDPTIIEIADPRNRQRHVASLDLVKGSAATSGLSERSFVVDGRRFGHILDPRDGQPCPGWGSVTVVADDPLAADCASTALFVMGPGEGAAWVVAQPDLEAVFVEISGDELRLTATAGLRQILNTDTHATITWLASLRARNPEPTGAAIGFKE